ncbi:RNA polymerase II elongation factor [Blyttiomyces sp. JEL0837]|nr:RNA polymerase II elongation factor [Blyttiomyces sp. JEL0837]
MSISEGEVLEVKKDIEKFMKDGNFKNYVYVFRLPSALCVTLQSQLCLSTDQLAKPPLPSQAAAAAMKELAKWRPTTDGLKKTKIGIFLNDLRKNAGATTEIKNLAKDFVSKWKDAVTNEKGAAGGSPGSPAQSGKADSPAKPLVKVITERRLSEMSVSNPDSPSPTTPMRDRNFKTDSVKPKSTGDKIRDKTVEMLYAAVGLGSQEETSVILAAATAIEAAMHKTCSGVSEKYKSLYRTLLANLKDKSNASLRVRVLSGDIDAESLVTMSPEELMSSEVKQAIVNAEKQHLHFAVTAQNHAAITDAFRCGKCGQRKCTYYQKQTRSADEPMANYDTSVADMYSLQSQLEVFII